MTSVSKLALAREALQQRRQRSSERFVDLDDQGILVAEVGMADAKNGARAMRIMASVVSSEVQLESSDLARLISDTTVGLHTRLGDGELEKLTHEDGTPLTFDARFGEAFGEPAVTDPAEAVLLVFTEQPEGQMPQVNGAALTSVATVFAGVLNNTGSDSSQDVSRRLGESGAQRS